MSAIYINDVKKMFCTSPRGDHPAGVSVDPTYNWTHVQGLALIPFLDKPGVPATHTIELVVCVVAVATSGKMLDIVPFYTCLVGVSTVEDDGESISAQRAELYMPAHPLDCTAPCRSTFFFFLSARRLPDITLSILARIAIRPAQQARSYSRLEPALRCSGQGSCSYGKHK